MASIWTTTSESRTRVDFALLVCALFLQRFNLPLPGGKGISLTIAPVVVILIHQFASGRLLVQYDRLLWFLLLALVATSSLLLNFESSFTSYALFLVVYATFIFTRPSTAAQYKNTLQGFQFLVLILCCLAILQVPAQFIVNPEKLLRFFGIFPESVLPYEGGPMGTIGAAGRLIKSNGIFLAEASSLSQMAALAILIEILEFRRPRYLIALTLGFLLAYGGTGLSILLLSLPLAALVNRRAQLPALLISLLAFGLIATGIVNLSAFTGRIGEFEDTHASGFVRFVSPFWQAADYLDRASLTKLLSGNGPGYGYIRGVFYAASSSTWFKLFLEYGLVGAFVFTCFCVSCFRKSRCPTPLIAGLSFNYLFTGNLLLDPPYLTIVAILCTLSGPDARQQHRSQLVSGPFSSAMSIFGMRHANAPRSPQGERHF